MTEIYLHNTKSRKKELFEPIDAENVRMYVCGPTVYDRAHMGNARAVVVFDVLYRLLRQVYGAEHVTYARNFTDVDDKINARAAETGRTIGEITAETTQWYLDDMAALGALEPDQMPRATGHIAQMVAMIELLIEKGHAYAAEGHVLFAVDSWKEGYGKLSGRSVDDMIAGARVEVAPYKKNPMDFVLWKPSDEGLPGWESPWGRGRPGWHIECSAMSYELFGATFDIHGGGNDLMFPHHENEIAQSCCAHPEGEFARYWLHNEMLQVEGKKMSKSLGNFFTVRDLLDQGVPGPVIRFVMLETHYRKPMDWTEAKKKNAARALGALVSVVATNPDLLEDTLEGVELDTEILEAIADDLNTSLAMTRLKAMGKIANDPRNFPNYEAQYAARRAVIVAAGFLGFDLVKMAKDKLAAEPKKDLGYFQSLLAHAYVAAKESKDFSEVDRLKAAYVDAGLKVQISREGIEVLASDDLDQSKLEALK